MRVRGWPGSWEKRKDDADLCRSAPSASSLADSPGSQLWQARTFTPQHGAVPDHAALLQDAGDGLRALSPEEAFITEEGDGASQLEAVTEPFAIHWNAGIWALVVSEGCVDGGQGRD